MMRKRIMSALLTVALTATAIPFPQRAVNAKAETTESNTEMSVDGQNSIGDLLADDIQEALEEDQSAAEYVVSSVEIDSSAKKAVIEYAAQNDCTIVLAIYSNDGTQLLKTFEARAEASTNTTEVNLGLYELPQYFYLKAYMISDGFFRPLSEYFESSLYTQEIQELKAKTVEDFDQDKLINLDDNDETNFLVLSDDVKLFSNEDATFVSNDTENGTYTFENLDEDMLALEKGDIFAFSDDSNSADVIVVKIAEIEKDGNKVTYTADNAESEDVFECIKIEASEFSGPAVDGTSDIAEGVTLVDNETPPVYSAPQLPIEGEIVENDGYTSDIEVETDPNAFNQKYELELELKDKDTGKEGWKGSVKLNGSIDIHFDDFNFQYLLNYSVQYVRFELEYKVGISVSISGAISYEIPLGEKIIPIFAGALSLKFKPVFFFTFSGEASVSITLTGSLGISAVHNGLGLSLPDLTNLSRPPEADFKLEAKGTFKAGVKLDIKLVGAEIVTLKLTPSLATIATAQTSPVSSSVHERHECELCIGGEIKREFKLSASMGFFQEDEFKKLSFTQALAKHLTISKDFVTVKKKLTDYHYSFDYKELAFEPCKHYRYRVDVRVMDNSGHYLDDATVTSQTGESAVTNKRGLASIWMTYGQNVLTVEKEGYDSEFQQLNVTEPQQTTVTLMSQDNTLDFPDYHRSFQYNGHSYTVYAYKCDDYDHAVTFCEKYGGYLAAINDEDENAFVQNMLKAYKWESAYIGAKINVYNKLVGENGIALGYANFNGDVPTDKQFYVKMNASDGKWTTDKKGTGDPLVFVCEWDSPNHSIYLDGDVEFDPDTGHVYQLLDNRGAGFNWFTEEKYCESLGGHMLCINNSNEQAFIENTVIDKYILKNPLCRYIHIGGYRKRNTNPKEKWHWVDGTNFTYTHWSEYQPDFKDKNETELSMYAVTEVMDGGRWTREKGRWNDFFGGDPGDMGDYFICEWEDANRSPLASTVSNAPSAAPNSIKLNGAFIGADTDDDEDDEQDLIGSVSYTDLTPNELYNFYIMRSKDSLYPLSEDNLLYIEQVVADENGEATIDYSMLKHYPSPDIFIVSAQPLDITKADITVSCDELNGEEVHPEVSASYNDYDLTEGVDYVLMGDFAVTSPGTHTVIVHGIGQFSGDAEAIFNVTGEEVAVTTSAVESSPVTTTTTTAVSTEQTSAVTTSEVVSSVTSVTNTTTESTTSSAETTTAATTTSTTSTTTTTTTTAATTTASVATTTETQPVDLSQYDPASDYKYEVLDDGTVAITGYQGNHAALKIPPYIEDKPVTKLADSAFEYSMSDPFEIQFTSVEIPDTVTWIGDMCFWHQSKLVNVKAPETLEHVGAYAFNITSWLDTQSKLTDVVYLSGIVIEGWHCTSSVELKDGTKGIADGAFGSSLLKNIYIPSSVTDIGEKAFSGCEGLTVYCEPDSYAKSYADNAGIKTVTDGSALPTADPLEDHLREPFIDSGSALLERNPDGTYTIVQYEDTNLYDVSGVNVAILDPETKKLTHLKCFSREDDHVGSVVLGEKYNFIIYGNDNYSERDDAIVMRVCKYSKTWEHLADLTLKGQSTYEPFRFGSVSTDEYDGKLYIHTCHTMYGFGSLNHQANWSYIIDEEEMKVLSSNIDGYDSSIYVSHSFQQRVAVDDSGAYFVDLGDSSPRAVVLQRTGKTDLSVNYCKRLLDIVGENGNNDTGVNVGGILLTDTSCITSFSSIVQEDGNSFNGPTELYIAVMNKESGTTEVRKLTEYSADQHNCIYWGGVFVESGDKYFMYWLQGDCKYLSDGSYNPDYDSSDDHRKLMLMEITADGEAVGEAREYTELPDIGIVITDTDGKLRFVNSESMNADHVELYTLDPDTLSLISTESYTVDKKLSLGDANCDGSVDAKDASFILAEYARLSTGGESSLSEAQKNSSDVNSDGNVDAKDASMILAYYSYLSTGGTDTMEVYLGKASA